MQTAIYRHDMSETLARHSLPKRHMQTAWTRMRRRVTQPLTRTQDDIHPGNIFTKFEQHFEN